MNDRVVQIILFNNEIILILQQLKKELLTRPNRSISVARWLSNNKRRVRYAFRLGQKFGKRFYYSHLGLNALSKHK